MAGKENVPGKEGAVKNTMAVLKDVSFSSPDRLLFFGVNLSIQKGNVATLTGESGVGKSTLLKIVLGKEVPDTGSVSLAKGIRASYVPQDVEDLDVEEDVTIRDLFYRSRGLDVMNSRMDELQAKMADPAADDFNATLDEYGELTEKFQQKGGYEADSEIKKILAGLKLDPESTGHITLDTRLTEVSSGQRTRALIGQALFADADLLVLDDPTSHLDVESVDWLSKYLKTVDKATLIATNHIPFINKSANQVIEITDFGRVLSFQGNYDQYMEKRDSLLTAEKAQAESVKAERDRLEATYKEFKSKQVFKRSSDMAAFGRALQTRIQKLDDRYEEMPGSKQVFREARVPDLKFESEKRSGEDVLSIKDVSKAYGNFVALDMIGQEISLKRGERFLVTGENGSGKSTLMRLVAAQAVGKNFEPSTGSIEVGASVKAAYYAPDNTGLPKSGNIFEIAKSLTHNNNESEAAAVLHFWGFHGGSARTREIETLSAGEKKQVALALVMLQHPNFLLLDEPTDYLKPVIIDRLVKAIQGYDGTLMLISHNQEFLRRLKIHRELKMPQGQIVLHENLK